MGPGESTGAPPAPARPGRRDSRRMAADTSDLRDAARLGGQALAGVAGAIRDTHLAIARRAFTLTGPPARPVQLVHDTISNGVYGAVRATMSGAATIGGAAVAARRAASPSYRPIADRPSGDVIVGAINGAWGDRLPAARHPLPRAGGAPHP